MEATAKNLLRTALYDASAEFRNGQWECIEALLRQAGRPSGCGKKTASRNIAP